MTHIINRNLLPAARAAGTRVLQRYQLQLRSQSLETDLESLIGVYFTAPVDFRRIIEKVFEILGLVEVISALKTSTHIMGLTHACGVLHTVVVSPCADKGCRFHKHNQKESLNCLLVYSRGNPLGVNQIAEFLGEPNVKEIIKAAVQKMRHASINAAKTIAELNEDFVFLHNLRVCGKCERRIKSKPYKVIDGVAFCSEHCTTVSPPEHTLLEARTGICAATLLQWVRENYTTTAAAAQAMGVPEAILRA